MYIYYNIVGVVVSRSRFIYSLQTHRHLKITRKKNIFFFYLNYALTFFLTSCSVFIHLC